MKSRILSLTAAFIVVLGLSQSTFAASATTSTFTVLNDINKINKIEIHGNVELFVSDGTTDQVKVYNQYYAESALIQNSNGVLRITSYKNEKLVVWVTANDLRSISAYDNAEVKSFGNLSKIEFNVDLHNNATAKLNLDTYNTNVVLTDQAKADLTGNTTEFNLNYDLTSKVSRNNFAAVHFTENKVNFPAETVNTEMFGM